MFFGFFDCLRGRLDGARFAQADLHGDDKDEKDEAPHLLKWEGFKSYTFVYMS